MLFEVLSTGYGKGLFFLLSPTYFWPSILSEKSSIVTVGAQVGAIMKDQVCHTL